MPSRSFYSDFAEHYEKIFPFRKGVESFLADHLPPGGRRVLDLGSGPGHYCGRFAAAGLEATGIDLDPEMIAAARLRYPDPDFQVMDLRSVGSLSGPFDLAWCIGNVAPHLPPADLANCLADVAALLNPGAVWILQTVNWDFILEQQDFLFPPRQLGEGQPVFHREYRDIRPDGLRFVTRLELAGREIFADEVRLYPMSRDDIAVMHRLAGFEEISIAADFAETPFDPAVFSGCVTVFRRRSSDDE